MRRIQSLGRQRTDLVTHNGLQVSTRHPSRQCLERREEQFLEVRKRKPFGRLRKLRTHVFANGLAIFVWHLGQPAVQEQSARVGIGQWKVVGSVESAGSIHERGIEPIWVVGGGQGQNSSVIGKSIQFVEQE